MAGGAGRRAEGKKILSLELCALSKTNTVIIILPVTDLTEYHNNQTEDEAHT